jgi:hypothetical protein
MTTQGKPWSAQICHRFPGEAFLLDGMPLLPTSLINRSTGGQQRLAFAAIRGKTMRPERATGVGRNTEKGLQREDKDGADG